MAGSRGPEGKPGGFQSLETALRKTGDPNDLKRAGVIADILEERGTDIALPPRIVTVHEKILRPILKFADQDRESLEKQGLMVLEFNGESVKSLLKKGFSFWSTLGLDGRRELLEQTARRSQVAVDPRQPLLSQSTRCTYYQQLGLLNRYSDQYRSMPGVEVVIGDVPDYAELAFAYFNATNGEALFREFYTRTHTYFEKEHETLKVMERFGTMVGEQHKLPYMFGDPVPEYYYNLGVSQCFDTIDYDTLGLLPLVVPRGWASLR